MKIEIHIQEKNQKSSSSYQDLTVQVTSKLFTQFQQKHDTTTNKTSPFALNENNQLLAFGNALIIDFYYAKYTNGNTSHERLPYLGQLLLDPPSAFADALLYCTCLRFIQDSNMLIIAAHDYEEKNTFVMVYRVFLRDIYVIPSLSTNISPLLIQHVFSKHIPDISTPLISLEPFRFQNDYLLGVVSKSNNFLIVDWSDGYDLVYASVYAIPECSTSLMIGSISPSQLSGIFSDACGSVYLIDFSSFQDSNSIPCIRQGVNNDILLPTIFTDRRQEILLFQKQSIHDYSKNPSSTHSLQWIDEKHVALAKKYGRIMLYELDEETFHLKKIEEYPSLWTSKNSCDYFCIFNGICTLEDKINKQIFLMLKQQHSDKIYICPCFKDETTNRFVSIKDFLETPIEFHMNTNNVLMLYFVSPNSNFSSEMIENMQKNNPSNNIKSNSLLLITLHPKGLEYYLIELKHEQEDTKRSSLLKFENNSIEKKLPKQLNVNNYKIKEKRSSILKYQLPSCIPTWTFPLKKIAFRSEYKQKISMLNQRIQITQCKLKQLRQSFKLFTEDVHQEMDKMLEIVKLLSG